MHKVEIYEFYAIFLMCSLAEHIKVYYCLQCNRKVVSI